jgi:hypothetical protein
MPAIPDGVCKLLAIGGLCNFVAFAMVSYALGGDAINGVVRGDAFFVGNHGEFTQVSELTYRLSYVHGVTAIIGVVMGALGTWRLESGGEAAFQTWRVPFGRVLVLTITCTILAWSFGVPARWGVPGILMLSGAVWFVLARAQQSSEPPTKVV